MINPVVQEAALDIAGRSRYRRGPRRHRRGHGHRSHRRLRGGGHRPSSPRPTARSAASRSSSRRSSRVSPSSPSSSRCSSRPPEPDPATGERRPRSSPLTPSGTAGEFPGASAPHARALREPSGTMRIRRIIRRHADAGPAASCTGSSHSAQSPSLEGSVSSARRPSFASNRTPVMRALNNVALRRATASSTRSTPTGRAT